MVHFNDPINPTLSGLATSDWFRADQIVSDIREPSLRLLLKLQFAGAVLAKELKSRQSKAVPERAAQEKATTESTEKNLHPDF